VVLLGPDEHWRANGLAPGQAVSCASRTDFSDGEHLVTVPDPGVLPGRHVLIVQTTAPPQHDRLLTLVQLVDVAMSAGAASVVCFVPYLCCQRQDRRMVAGEALTARVVLRILGSFGVRALITVDRHSVLPQLPGEVPVVNLSCAGPFAAYIRSDDRAPDLVVAADAGGAGRAGAIAGLLGVACVTMDKHKDPGIGTNYPAVPDNVDGRRCLIVEDLCSEGSTLVPLYEVLRPRVRDVQLVVTHILTSVETITARLPGIGAIGYTDSCGDARAPVHVLGDAAVAWQQILTGSGQEQAWPNAV
jgi:ribose-phosphate pyrophosphokinase